jgi:dextranase
MKKLLTLILLSNLIFALIGCVSVDLSEGNQIVALSTDKAMYNPLEKVTFDLSIKDISKGKVIMDIYHLDKVVFTNEYKFEDEENLTLTWDTPIDDYTGYLALIKLYEGNQIIDYQTIGVDVSSDWAKFPRYGYLSKYPNMSNEEITEVIKYLNRYHINGLQFYDWQYKHHLPIKNDGEAISLTWPNIANNTVYFNTVKNYIDTAHLYNMKAMNYNLIFGAYSTYENDGLDSSMGLYKDTSATNQDYHPLPSTWATSKLMLMNPLNEDWQDYLMNQEKFVFDTLGFDGWHMDQLGYRGMLFDSSGLRVYLDQTYDDFITYMDSELGVDIIFNLVNDYGLLELLTSEELEFIYTEIWNLASYAEIKGMIENYTNIADKSVVMAGYMNYDLSGSKGEFNLPGVILANSTIFAAGGSHIELGDHGLLGNEYFPNDNLKMTDELEEKLIAYYDFLVAYENILRDGVVKANLKIESPNLELTSSGMGDRVWYFSKKVNDLDIIHLINLLGNDTEWRDDLGTKNNPIIQEDFVIKCYIDKEITNVYLASPDVDKGVTQNLDYNISEDEDGKYIEISVPYLEYWDVLVIE